MMPAISIGRRRDQPDPLALVEVQLGQRPGAGPDPGRHRLVEDLLAQLLELEHRVALDEGERGRLGVGHVGRVLGPDHPELRLLPRGRGDLPRREEAPAVEPASQVEDARALHQGVVDVEERGDLRLGRRGQGVLDLGRGRGRLTGHRGPALEVQPTGCGHSDQPTEAVRFPGGPRTPVEPWTDVPGQRPRRVGGAARAHPGRRPGGAGGRPRRRPRRARGDLGTPSDLGGSRPRGRPRGHRSGRRRAWWRGSGCCWPWATASSS